jgi:hypothetical protein
MFALFAGNYHTLIGGWENHIGTFLTQAEARKAAELRSVDYDWIQIVDLAKGEIVEQY